jgi:aminobenzoyl-glutamate utilization protein B
MKKQGTLFTFLFFISIIASSQKGKGKIPDQTKDKQDIITSLNSKYDYYKERAMKIWNYAEVGFKEEKSTALLQQTLKENGFTIQSGVADIPTAFVASYGSGSPVIGILAEFDALPGMSQTGST